MNFSHCGLKVLNLQNINKKMVSGDLFLTTVSELVSQCESTRVDDDSPQTDPFQKCLWSNTEGNSQLPLSPRPRPRPPLKDMLTAVCGLLDSTPERQWVCLLSSCGGHIWCSWCWKEQNVF